MEEEKTNVETTTTEEKVVNVNEEKKFTQKELDEYLESRLAKERKKGPSKEEMEEFQKWKDSQKTEEEKKKESEIERQKIMSENEELKRTIKIRDAGVKKDDIDYVLFKLSKMEGNFEDNLKDFLEKNPKFTSSDKKLNVELGGNHGDKRTKDDSRERNLMRL